MTVARENRRVVLIVLDGVGCGELPDAGAFGDAGANTLGNLARRYPEGLRLPNLERLGLGKVIEIRGLKANAARPAACYGRAAELSAGKDSTTGHWEIAGVVTKLPYPTYPEGFPDEVIDPFTDRIGRGILGNKAASGTEIIEELGAEHLATGKPIVYTSADSVFQIAAHERVFSLEGLYELCATARDMLAGRHGVSRVIARPFVGEPGSFRRTSARKDYSLAPPGPTLLDRLSEEGVETIAIGKIGDLFAHRGISREIHTMNNMEGFDATLEVMRSAEPPVLIFTNLVEFDQLYGHRNDCDGYRGALEDFDRRLPELLAASREGDLLMLTSDHGTDPTTASTDHTREYAPLLAWGRGLAEGEDLGTRESFADVGQTIAEYLGCEPLAAGTSFLGQLMPVQVPAAEQDV